MTRTEACWRAGAAALAVVLGLEAGEARAQRVAGFGPALLLYEPFDYPGENQDITGQNGGFGFDGAWSGSGFGQAHVTGRTNFASGAGTTINAVGGLDFPGLPTAGSALSRFGNAGQREASRTLSDSARAALTQNDTTVWFSLLLGPTVNEGARVATFIFGTDRFHVGSDHHDSFNGTLSAEGQAFGVGLFIEHPDGGHWAPGSGSPNAVAFVNSRVAIAEEASDFTPTAEAEATHQNTVFVVGKINWTPNGTPDELFLFNVTSVDLPEPDEADAIASLAADVDQSTWNTIAVWDSGFSIIDEIRMGTTYKAVLGRPAPPATLIAVR